MCARALCSIRDDGFLPIQILNGSQQTVILHKGTKIASFYPIQNVCVVEDKTSVNTATESLNVVDFSDADMGGSELTESQRGELMSLLQKYKSLFPKSNDGSLGRTSIVKHGIITEGPPIRQKYRRLPFATKNVVNEEVQKMLNAGIIRHTVPLRGKFTHARTSHECVCPYTRD